MTVKKKLYLVFSAIAVLTMLTAFATRLTLISMKRLSHAQSHGWTFSCDIANARRMIGNFLAQRDVREMQGAQQLLDSAVLSAGLVYSEVTVLGRETPIVGEAEQLVKNMDMYAAYTDSLSDVSVQWMQLRKDLMQAFARCEKYAYTQGAQGEGYEEVVIPFNRYLADGDTADYTRAYGSLNRLLSLPSLSQSWRTELESMHSLMTRGQKIMIHQYAVDRFHAQIGEKITTGSDKLQRMLIESIDFRSRSMSIVVLLLSFLTLGSVFGLGYIVTRTIQHNVKRMVAFLSPMSSGDFTMQADGKWLAQRDEFGSLARTSSDTVGNVRQSIGKVTEGVEAITGASVALSAEAQRISEGANTQASSVEEISSAMEEMAANIDQNADSAAQSGTISRQLEERIRSVNADGEASLRALYRRR